jgi:ABC-2 type transport system ATP-binding protein
VAGKRYRHYSLGMKQRLGIAAALLKDAELLILDEPTNGLDPQGTREIRTLIRELHAEGATVVLSSHLLSEVEQVCTDVAVMARGKLLAQGPLEDMRQMTAPALAIEATTATAAKAGAVLTGLGLEPVAAGPAGFKVASERLATPVIVRELVQAGVELLAVTPRRQTLEDVFVELTGAGFDVDG